MYDALCVSGAVNMQGFVWKFLCAIYTFLFIHSYQSTSSFSALSAPLFRTLCIGSITWKKTLNQPILHLALDVRTNGLPSTWDFVISR